GANCQQGSGERSRLALSGRVGNAGRPETSQARNGVESDSSTCCIVGGFERQTEGGFRWSQQRSNFQNCSFTSKALFSSTPAGDWNRCCHGNRGGGLVGTPA